MPVRWFDGGKTNASVNCLDRHLEKVCVGRPLKTKNTSQWLSLLSIIHSMAIAPQSSGSQIIQTNPVSSLRLLLLLLILFFNFLPTTLFFTWWYQHKTNLANVLHTYNQSPTARNLTYADLHQQVCKFANALRDLGVGKGTFLPKPFKITDCFSLFYIDILCLT